MFLLTEKLFLHISALFGKTHFRIHIKRKFKSWNVMFFGSDEFSVVSLEGLFSCLENKRIKKLEVVCLHYSSPVAKYAVSKKLKLHVWPPPYTDSFDIGIVVSFGKLIPKKVIEFFPLGIINVHPSLLPQYRGANPIFHAIRNGDCLTGITIMKIKPFKFDTGDIVLQETYEIGSDDLFLYVHEGLAQLGAKCLVKIINDLPPSLEKSAPQNSNEATSAPKTEKSVSVVKWDKATAAEIYNLYRAVFGLYKLSTTWNSKEIKLICISPNFIGKSQLFDNVKKKPPGTVEYCNETNVLGVHCLDRPLYICTLQMAHKVFLAREFYKGCLNRVSRYKWFFQ